MAKKVAKEILEEYEKNYNQYSEFCEMLQTLIGQIAKESSIELHNISGRVKTKASLSNKIELKSSKPRSGDYKCIHDITDIIGVRVTAFFADDIDKLAAAIEKEFLIDKANSVDKRRVLEPDRFGYLSLHYIISLTEKRINLTEYKKWDGLKAEIQIRTILQHAWAEIEHDLGYKTEAGVPSTIRRRFSRLAGLLELADEEFNGIRNDLQKYEQDVSKSIIKNPDSIEINDVSLKSFIFNNPLVGQIDVQIGYETNTPIEKITDKNLGNDRIASHVQKLSYLGIKSIGEIEKLLTKYKEIIPKFARKWVVDDELGYDPIDDGAFPAAVTVFYLCYVILGAQDDEDKVKEYFETILGLSVNDEDEDEIANYTLSVNKQTLGQIYKELTN